MGVKFAVNCYAPFTFRQAYCNDQDYRFSADLHVSYIAELPATEYDFGSVHPWVGSGNYSFFVGWVGLKFD